MNKVIFPIKSKNACLLKWCWSTIYFNSGTSASCHRTQKYSIDPDNFFQFHNLPEKIHARELMLNEQWPGAGCEYCKKIEDAGGTSDRLFQIDQLYDQKLVPPEIYTNPRASHVSPTILEVYFKNTCNMACVYCGPHYSSKWADENKKYGYPHDKTEDKFSVTLEQSNPNYKNMVQGLWSFLKSNNNAKNIQRYHILGGEPFLLDELDQSIAFWSKHGHPDLQISLISNLNIPHERFQHYLKKFELLAAKNKIWRLQLTGSLDCWGQEQEYVRYGLDMSLWEKNFESMLNKPWVHLSVNSAISALSIKSLPKLIEKIKGWNLFQQDVNTEWRSYSNLILHSFNTTGEIDSPYIFSGDVFESEFRKTLDLMPTDNEIYLGQKQMMEGIANLSKKCSNDIEKINSLKKYLTILDSRRGTNWKKTFPWLEQIKT